MINAWKPDLIVSAGDLAYENDTPTANVFKGDPIACYGDYIQSPAEDPDGTKTRFFSAMGNHEYSHDGGSSDATRLKHYQQTFAIPPGEGSYHYFEVLRGPVRFFFLDSNQVAPNKAAGVGGWKTGSAQHGWFQNRVAASPEKWKFVVYHHTAWTSGLSYDDLTFMRPWEFEKSGVTASIAGHSHVYERVMKGGFPFFTVGLSGTGAYPFPSGGLFPGSTVRLGKGGATMDPAPKRKNGALFCEATAEMLVMEYWTISGEMADRWPENAEGLTRKPAKP